MVRRRERHHRRKQAEFSLQEERDRLSELVNGIRDEIWFAGAGKTRQWPALDLLSSRSDIELALLDIVMPALQTIRRPTRAVWRLVRSSGNRSAFPARFGC